MAITEIHVVKFSDGDRTATLRIDRFNQLNRVLNTLSVPDRDAIHSLIRALFPRITPDDAALITDEIMDPTTTQDWLAIAERNIDA